MPCVEMRPCGVEGSAYSPPAIWKVSRQRPMLGRLVAFIMAQVVAHVGLGRCQYYFSVWRRGGGGALRVGRPGQVLVGEAEVMLGEHVGELLYVVDDVFWGCRNPRCVARSYLQHICAQALHDANPTSSSLEGILSLFAPFLPALEVG